MGSGTSSRTRKRIEDPPARRVGGEACTGNSDFPGGCLRTYTYVHPRRGPVPERRTRREYHARCDDPRTLYAASRSADPDHSPADRRRVGRPHGVGPGDRDPHRQDGRGRPRLPRPHGRHDPAHRLDPTRRHVHVHRLRQAVARPAVAARRSSSRWFYRYGGWATLAALQAVLVACTFFPVYLACRATRRQAPNGLPADARRIRGRLAGARDAAAAARAAAVRV